LLLLWSLLPVLHWVLIGLVIGAAMVLAVLGLRGTPPRAPYRTS